MIHYAMCIYVQQIGCRHIALKGSKILVIIKIKY